MDNKLYKNWGFWGLISILASYAIGLLFMGKYQNLIDWRIYPALLVLGLAMCLVGLWRNKGNRGWSIAGLVTVVSVWAVAGIALSLFF